MAVLAKVSSTLPDSQEYTYEDETRSHRHECVHCHCPDVGAGNGNDHATGDFNASGTRVVCQAYNDDPRPKWANLVNGERSPTKTTRIKLNKTLDAKIKGLVLTDAQ